jgi:hypothetical protein
LFVVAWFRKREDITVLGAGFGISRATAYRYHDEAIDVLAGQPPDLHEALQRAKDEGFAYVVLDGKVFPADRYGETTTSVKGTQIDLWYSRESARTRWQHPGPLGTEWSAVVDQRSRTRFPA